MINRTSDARLRPGAGNRITDVSGLRVGNADDARLKSGVTVLTADAPFTAGYHVMGGAPGTRETDLLAPDKTVKEVDALVLAGGSAYGLDAASGVVEALRGAGRGFRVGDQYVPIVPAAILFDLLNGGDKNWGENPYRALGRAAFETACEEVPLGTVGAGSGAMTATVKGGIGTASVILPPGQTVGALVAVNAVGSPVVGQSKNFWAAPWEIGSEFGGLGCAPAHDATLLPDIKGTASENTTIAVVATDAALDVAQCTRLAVAAHDGIGRALVPSHTPMDGDLVFAASTGARPVSGADDLLWLCHGASHCLARAIARGVYAASPAPGDQLPCWSEL